MITEKEKDLREQVPERVEAFHVIPAGMSAYNPISKRFLPDE